MVCLMWKIVALRFSFSSSLRSRELSSEYSPFFSVSSRRLALEKTSRGCLTLHIRTRFSSTSIAGPPSPTRFASRRKTPLLIRSAVSVDGRPRAAAHQGPDQDERRHTDDGDADVQEHPGVDGTCAEIRAARLAVHLHEDHRASSGRTVVSDGKPSDFSSRGASFSIRGCDLVFQQVADQHRVTGAECTDQLAEHGRELGRSRARAGSGGRNGRMSMSDCTVSVNRITISIAGRSRPVCSSRETSLSSVMHSRISPAQRDRDSRG